MRKVEDKPCLLNTLDIGAGFNLPVVMSTKGCAFCEPNAFSNITVEN